MFQRRSTLDPVEKHRKHKQTEYLTIIDKCLQIPSDDKLTLRDMVKHNHPQLLSLLNQFKKNKNLSALQIALRKILQNHKLQQSTHIFIKDKDTPQTPNYHQPKRLSDQQWGQRRKIVKSQRSQKYQHFTPNPNDIPLITIEVTKSIQVNDQSIDQHQLQQKIQDQIQDQINKEINNLNDITINFKDITIRDDDKSFIIEQSNQQQSKNKQILNQQSKYDSNNHMPMPTFGCEDISRVSGVESYFVSQLSHPNNLFFDSLNNSYSSRLKSYLSKNNKEKAQQLSYQTNKYQNPPYFNSNFLKKQINKNDFDFPYQNHYQSKTLSNLNSIQSKKEFVSKQQDSFNNGVQKFVTLGAQDIKQMFIDRGNIHQTQKNNQINKISLHNSRTIQKQPNIEFINTLSNRSNKRNTLSESLIKNKIIISSNQSNNRRLQITKKLKFDNTDLNQKFDLKSKISKIKTTNNENTNQLREYKFGQFYKRIKLTVDGTLD